MHVNVKLVSPVPNVTKNVILDSLVSDAYKNAFVKMGPIVMLNLELASVKLAGMELTGKFKGGVPISKIIEKIFSEKPCPDGYWGEECQEVCSCAQNGSKCDHVSGECKCGPGYYGDNCDELCPAGTFGSGCSKICVCGIGSNDCDPINGRCLCQPGYTGPMCNKGKHAHA